MKPKIIYALKHPNGELTVFEMQRAWLIETAECLFGQPWAEIKKQGKSCVKVQVTELPAKRTPKAA